MTKISGSCLCGAVSYEGDVEPAFSANCHCADCRKLSGNGHLALMAVAGDQIKIDGESKAHSVTADSGATVTNYFCPNCGSQVYKTGTGMENITLIVASTLDDPEFYKPGMTVYASRALSWDQPNPETQQFDTMPPMDG